MTTDEIIRDAIKRKKQLVFAYTVKDKKGIYFVTPLYITRLTDESGSRILKATIKKAYRTFEKKHAGESGRKERIIPSFLIKKMRNVKIVSIKQMLEDLGAESMRIFTTPTPREDAAMKALFQRIVNEFFEEFVFTT